MHNHPIVMADADGIIQFWNAAAEKCFGHATAEAVGQSLNLIVPAEYQQAHWAGFRHAVRAGKANVEGKPTDFPVRRADGRTGTTKGRLTLLREPGGAAIAAMVIFENGAKLED